MYNYTKVLGCVGVVLPMHLRHCCCFTTVMPTVELIVAAAAKLEKEVGARNRHEFGEWANIIIVGGHNLHTDSQRILLCVL